VEKRSYTVNIPMISEPESVRENGTPVAKEKWTWLKDRKLLTVETGKRSIREATNIEVK